MRDLDFASHPADEARAKAMMKAAFASGASLDDVLKAIADFLASKSADEAHINEQLDHARKLRLRSNAALLKSHRDAS